MSFYGNVFYEFKNLFQKFKFLNDGADNAKVDFTTVESGDSGTVATQNWDTLHMISGNHWIRLSELPTAGTRKGVQLFHAAPNTTSVKVHNTFAPTETEGVVLKADQAFETVSFNVDPAGHIAGVKTTTYQLPDSHEMVQAGLEKYHYDILSRQCIKAKDEPEGGGLVELTPGQELEVLSLNYTDKGLLTDFTTRTYKLPMSDAEKDYAEMQERMTQAEKTLTELVEEIPNTYTTIADTGVVDDFYTNPEEQDEKFESITKAIGNLEASSQLMFPEATHVENLSAQIEKLYDIITQKTAEVSTFATAIEGLQARVKLLEKQVEELSATE